MRLEKLSEHSTPETMSYSDVVRLFHIAPLIGHRFYVAKRHRNFDADVL